MDGYFYTCEFEGCDAPAPRAEMGDSPLCNQHARGAEAWPDIFRVLRELPETRFTVARLAAEAGCSTETVVDGLFRCTGWPRLVSREFFRERLEFVRLLTRVFPGQEMLECLTADGEAIHSATIRAEGVA